MDTKIIEILKQSSSGLLMMSESEYPFEVVNWQKQDEEPLTEKKILQLAGHPEDAFAEKVELEYFFRNCAFEEDWHEEAQKQEVARFQILLNALRENLQEVEVYRVGTVNIDVYIVGKTLSKNIVGVSTKVVET